MCTVLGMPHQTLIHSRVLLYMGSVVYGTPCGTCGTISCCFLELLSMQITVVHPVMSWIRNHRTATVTSTTQTEFVHLFDQFLFHSRASWTFCKIKAFFCPCSLYPLLIWHKQGSEYTSLCYNDEYPKICCVGQAAIPPSQDWGDFIIWITLRRLGGRRGDLYWKAQEYIL